MSASALGSDDAGLPIGEGNARLFIVRSLVSGYIGEIVWPGGSSYVRGASRAAVIEAAAKLVVAKAEVASA